MTLLEMTLSGGAVILLITVVRALAVDRLPKRTFPALWGAALLRLLVPFSAPFRFSPASLMERGDRTAVTAAAVTHNRELAAAAKRPAAAVRAASGGISPWMVLWLAGLGLALLLFMAAYVRHLRRFRSAGAVENGFISGWLASHPLRRTISVRESGGVTTPLTYGVLRPVILVPTGLDWEDAETLNYVFTHEYIHIRRFDALLRLLLAAALCVHWFNPLVWAMYILALRDIELSCDEAVVRRFGLESRRAYALALLKMEETRLRFSAFASGFSRNAAEERLRAVMRLRKPTALRAAASAALVLGISAVLCTGAAAADSGTLKESPGLSCMSMEELVQAHIGEGNYFPGMREGDFIRLTVSGRGGCTLGFFLYSEETGRYKGQWITLDGSTRELWLETPGDGKYCLYVAGGHDGNCSYRVRHTCYFSDGSRASRWARGPYDGYWTVTRTIDQEEEIS